MLGLLEARIGRELEKAAETPEAAVVARTKAPPIEARA